MRDERERWSAAIVGALTAVGELQPEKPTPEDAARSIHRIAERLAGARGGDVAHARLAADLSIQVMELQTDLAVAKRRASGMEAGIRSYELPAPLGHTEQTDDPEEAVAAWQNKVSAVKEEFASVVADLCEGYATLEESERVLRERLLALEVTE